MFPFEFRGEFNRDEARVMGLLIGEPWKLHDLNFKRFCRAMHFSAKRGIAIAARSIAGLRRSDHITDTLASFHWLQWRNFKFRAPLQENNSGPSSRRT